jgi:tRNA A-37 threonylcarbamoyl transferase component Bud32
MSTEGRETASDGPEGSVVFWQEAGATGPACSEEPSKAGRARQQAPTRQPLAYAPAVCLSIDPSCLRADQKEDRPCVPPSQTYSNHPPTQPLFLYHLVQHSSSGPGLPRLPSSLDHNPTVARALQGACHSRAQGPTATTMSQAQIQPCRYKTGKTLGAGSYSVVKECVHIDTGRYYAAKVINKRLMAGREHMVRNEIAVLKRVSMGHQNILTLVDYFETMNNLYLVTDLALGGELFDRICRKGSYYESDAADLIRATLSAVAYLHDHGIVHRDLKPENLLFRTPEDNADLMIADFGLSRIMDEEQFHVLTTTCGTPGYMAPEIFNKSGHGKPV